MHKVTKFFIAIMSLVGSLAGLTLYFLLLYSAHVPGNTSEDGPASSENQFRAVEADKIRQAEKIQVRAKGWQVMRGDEPLCDDPFIDGPNQVIICPALERNPPEKK